MKMTLDQLASRMNTYVAAAKIAGSWSDSHANFVGLLDKIAKSVTIDGTFNDKLPELDGEDLPLGKTIEEYFIDLTLPESWTDCATDGAYDNTPSLPSVESVCYSYTLGRQKVKTTIPYDNFERGCGSAAEAANVGAKIVERLQNSYDLTKYQMKKQLIGRAADMAVAAGKVVPIASPSSTETGEAFIKQIKSDVEAASFAHQGGIANALIGAAPEMVLFIKKGYIPSLEVDTLAGAFNRGDLALPCRIKVVDDFGTMTNSSVYAVLVDPRGIKLHNGYNAVRSHENAEGDFVNLVRHFEETGFVSKYVEIKAYKNA